MRISKLLKPLARIAAATASQALEEAQLQERLKKGLKTAQGNLVELKNKAVTYIEDLAEGVSTADKVEATQEKAQNAEDGDYSGRLTVEELEELEELEKIRKAKREQKYAERESKQKEADKLQDDMLKISEEFKKNREDITRMLEDLRSNLFVPGSNNYHSSKLTVKTTAPKSTRPLKATDIARYFKAFPLPEIHHYVWISYIEVLRKMGKKLCEGHWVATDKGIIHQDLLDLVISDLDSAEDKVKIPDSAGVILDNVLAENFSFSSINCKRIKGSSPYRKARIGLTEEDTRQVVIADADITQYVCDLKKLD